MRPIFVSGWGLLLAVATGVVPVWAAPDAERLKTAAEEFDAGRRAYKVKDFESAASHFENADRDAPSPDALLAAIRSRKEAQQLARAATLSAAALARYPADKALGDAARQVIGDAEKALHKVSVTCSPECTLVVDNKLVPFPESTNAVIYLDPGPHTVVAGWPGDRHVSRDIAATAAAGTRLSLVAPAERLPTTTATTTPPDDKAIESAERDDKKAPVSSPATGLPPAVFFAGAGVTAVLAGITVWSGIDTQNNPGVDAVKQTCHDTSCDLYQEGLAHQRRTNILIGATTLTAVATGVIGLFLTKWGSDSDKEKEKVKGSEAGLSPLLDVSHGVVLGAVGRF
jgi:hypothetical protein